MVTPIIKPIISKPKPKPFDFPNGFAGGMDISVEADQIPYNCTPDVINMMLFGGKWKKRYGFKRVNSEAWAGGPIRGMHIFKPIGAQPIFLFAQGGKIWSLNTETGIRTDLCTGSKATIIDAQTNFFDHGGKCYAYNGTDYVVYDGVNPVTDVVGYIPTVITGANPDNGAGITFEDYNYLSNSFKITYSCDAAHATTTTFKLPRIVNAIVSAKVNGVDAAYTFNGTDTVTFSTAPGEGTDHVEITATVNNLMDSTIIKKCTMHIFYGGKNDTKLFLAGNPDLPNYRFRSGSNNLGVNDVTYFPENDYDIIGSDASKITGMGVLADYLYTYKEDDKRFYSTIDYDTSGVVSFPTYPSNDQYGCIAPRTVLQAQDGLLALSRQGVTWSMPTTVRAQFTTKVISENINGKNGIASGILDNTDEDLRSAHAYIFDQKYFLHIKDKVWVLDLRYSNLPKGIACWYPWDNVPGLASCFIEENDRLLLGSKVDGFIYASRLSTDPDNLKYKEYSVALNIKDTFFDSYWTSPIIYFDRSWVKKFERIHLTFHTSEVPADAFLTLITPDSEETITIPINSTYFNYNYAYYDRWNYGVETEIPETQSEKIGFKGEYFQIMIRSGWDNPAVNFSYSNFDYANFNYDNPYMEDIGILSCIIHYSMRKLVK